MSGRCHGCMKFGIVAVAFLFILTGLAVMGLSTYLLLQPVDGSFTELTRNDEYLYYGKIFLLVSGCLMLMGGILGCCGSIKQSSACLSLFLAIVLIISLSELAAGVYFYAHRGEFMDYFRILMKDSVQNQYNRDEVISNAWDLLQKEMQCCGASNYRDYQSTKPGVDMTLSSLSATGTFSIPASCCVDPASVNCDKENLKIPSIGGGESPVLDNIFKNGCSEKLIEWLSEQTYIIMATLIVVGSIQFLIILFTCILICAFRTRRTYKN